MFFIIYVYSNLLKKYKKYNVKSAACAFFLTMGFPSYYYLYTIFGHLNSPPKFLRELSVSKRQRLSSKKTRKNEKKVGTIFLRVYNITRACNNERN